MNEILLCRCTSSILSNNVTDILDANSIWYRMHDETADQCNGAYGPNPGIAIYVFESDFMEASALIEHIINRPYVRYSPFCPNCGSEDTESINRSKYATPLTLISLPLFIIPGVYLYHSKDWGIISWIAVAVFLISIILMIISTQMGKNCKCKKCGKRFSRM